MSEKCERAPSLLRSVAPAVVLAALLALPTIPTSAEEQASRVEAAALQESRFRVEIDNVEVGVSVTTSDGSFVRGLGAADFQVIEDGKPQKISAFTLIDGSVQALERSSRGAAPTLEPEPDVRSNELAATGRVYVIVLDDLHTAPLRSSQVKEVARRFLEQYVTANDVVAVVRTSGGGEVARQFTTSRRLLLEAVDAFTGRKLRSSVLARLEEYQRLQTVGQLDSSRADVRLYQVFDPLDAERADHARSMLETLQHVGDLLDSVRGRRKAIVLISEGIDYNVEGGVEQTTSGLSTFSSPSAADLRQRMRDATRSATRSNATIYSIDPRGLATTGDEIMSMQSPPANPLLGLGPTAFQEELQRSQDTLRVLADETGGTASVSSNDFTPIFERIVRDSSTYYMLGYGSTNDRRDGRFRQIQVRVNRPGVRVLARKGYTAPTERGVVAPQLLTTKAEPVAELRAAANSPVPLAGLGLRVFAAPFKSGSEASVLVGVEAEGRRFRFDQRDGLYTDKLSVALAALDERGVLHTADRHIVDMRLKPETYEAVRGRGLRLLFRLALPAGRYQLRVAAHESGTGTTGSVHYDLEVPDFMSQPLQMSGVILTATHAALTPTARADPTLGSVLRDAPTAAREFGADESLSAYLEVYPNVAGRAAPTDLVTSLVAPDGRVVFRSRDPLAADGGAGVGWLIPIPLADVPPGQYVLRVEAPSRTPGDVAAVREVVLAVRQPASQ